MNQEIEATYTQELFKFAVWKFWMRSIGVGGAIGFAIVCIGFCYFLISGDRSWFVGFLGSVVGLCVLFGLVLYFVTLNRSMGKFRQMEKPVANFVFSDDRISINSDIGSTEISWKMIEKIWKYPSVWLVFITKQGYLTLPTASLDEELMEFISFKVEKSGSRIS